MSGRELAERLTASRPELPILFMSGYTDDVVVRHGVARDRRSFLPKPFTRETLLRAVSEVFSRRHG
jgi:FixJ family two-component response regulator